MATNVCVTVRTIIVVDSYCVKWRRVRLFQTLQSLSCEQTDGRSGGRAGGRAGERAGGRADGRKSGRAYGRAGGLTSRLARKKEVVRLGG